MSNAMKYTDEQIIAYLHGELDEGQSADMESWIQSSAEARARIEEFRMLEQLFADAIDQEPPAEMLYTFREKIAEERELKASPHWYRAAAAVVLMVAGFGIGRVSLDNGESTQEFTDLKSEVQVLQQMVMMNTLRDQSASERLQVINRIEETPAIVDDELIETLIQTLNHDESPNVRFAVVQALARFIQQEEVRHQMVRSLAEQEDPLVQIAMINILIEAQEKAAIAPIRKIAANEDVPEEVRRTAEIALDLLI